MKFKRENVNYYLKFEDYSDYPLIDLSIETFKYLDEYGITFLSPLLSVKVTENESNPEEFQFKNELHDLLNDINVFSDLQDIDINVQVESYNDIKKKPSLVSKYFFLKFYINSKEYSELFKIITNYTQNTHFNSYEIDKNGNKRGIGQFRDIIYEQLDFYITTYIKIHTGRTLRLTSIIDTEVDKDGSPIFYRGSFTDLFVCKKNMESTDISRLNIEEYNNNNIKTFNSIEKIGSLYLVDNNTLISLGNIRRITSSCFLKNSSIRDIQNLKRVGENLTIDNCENINSLEDIYIGKNLNIQGSEINQLKNVIVKGELKLNEKFKNNYSLENCTIEGKIRYYCLGVNGYVLYKTPEEIQRIKLREEQKKIKSVIRENNRKRKIYDCKEEKLITLNKISEIVGKKITPSLFNYSNSLYGRFILDEGKEDNKVLKQWKNILDSNTNNVERHNIKSFSTKLKIKENNVWGFFNGRQKVFSNRYSIVE